MRLARWLNQHVAQLTPKEEPFHPVHVHPGSRGLGLHAPAPLVLKYGTRAILEAVHELTYWRDMRGSSYRELLQARLYGSPDQLRCWRDEIVSPARRLLALVRENHELSRLQARGQL